MNKSTRFDQPNTEEPRDNTAMIFGIIAALLFLLYCYQEVAAVLTWIGNNRDLIAHVLVAAAIFLIGSSLTTKVSTSFDQAFRWSNMWLTFALLYLAVMVGLPLLTQAIKAQLAVGLFQ